MVNTMTRTKGFVAAIVAVLIGVALAGVLYWHSYWMDVKEYGQAIVWKGYEVTSFVDNQRRVHDHHGIDDPVATSDYGGYRYFVYADGSCERLEF